MVDTMGDLLTARRHFDRAMTIKNGQGCVAALPEFVAATEADPSMADAWLGRIACGDRDLASLKQLNAIASGCTARPRGSAGRWPLRSSWDHPSGSR
ncbi:ESX CONSERVED COMPONENT ECCA2, PROBABLE CBXX/CFQX FAMILY protein [Mycobacterium tuberculosis]|nr:ESX CONSERVED COMPONENT ECCA2, PROBABLE CBXX/CFQX FAMILY protein [Mycobacterium tuberculosis]